MVSVSIRTSGFDDVSRLLDRMRDDLQDRAASAALNKVGAKAQTEMVRAITDEYNIERSEVAPRMSLSKASRTNLMVQLDPFASKRKGRALNLIHFLEKKVTLAEARRRARNGKLSVTTSQGRQLPILYFKIKRTGPSKPIPGTFIGNRGRTVFMRVGKSRLPIEAKATIDVPQMFNSKNISARVVERINKELPIEVDRAIKMVLERYR